MRLLEAKWWLALHAMQSVDFVPKEIGNPESVIKQEFLPVENLNLQVI